MLDTENVELLLIVQFNNMTIATYNYVCKTYIASINSFMVLYIYEGASRFFELLMMW